MRKILVLGGTTEAGELCARLADDDRLLIVTSLAGLTRLPRATAGPVRRGGFGGPQGLASLLVNDGYDALVDATHPFAAQIAAHAVEAAEAAQVPRVKLLRPSFPRRSDARVIDVGSMQGAADALPQRARIFLAAGRRELAAFRARPDLSCVLRMIEPPAVGEVLPEWTVILGRPAETPQAELELLRAHNIGFVVAKDSGGPAFAKIVAARMAGIPTVMIRRPPPPSGPIVSDVDGVLAWIEVNLFAGNRNRGLGGKFSGGA
ncbi:MAG: cobalt-precorrin-6A reductase [Alphaproteobacteria bacterium]